MTIIAEGLSLDEVKSRADKKPIYHRNAGVFFVSELSNEKYNWIPRDFPDGWHIIDRREGKDRRKGDRRK